MRAVHLFPLILLTGCSSLGPISAPPTPVSPNPVTVTVHRVDSIVGAPLPMVFVIDGAEIYGLGNGDSYTFKLDPGQYVFGWRFGMNSCDQDVWLRPGRKINLTLSNECDIPPGP